MDKQTQTFEIDFNYSDNKELEIAYKKSLQRRNPIEALKIIEPVFNKIQDNTYQYFEVFEIEARQYFNNKNINITKNKRKEFVRQFINETKYQKTKEEIPPFEIILNTGFEFYGTAIFSHITRLRFEKMLIEISTAIDEQTTQFEKIDKLIEAQYKNYTGLFSDEFLDEIFAPQYNFEIKKRLNEKIKEIQNQTIKPIDEHIKQVIKKPLKWNANKNTIGTLFGLLHKAKIIDGSISDISKGLTALFENLNENTLKDNINLKVNTNENKVLHDIKTDEFLKDWIDYLKTQKQTKTTPKKPNLRNNDTIF